MNNKLAIIGAGGHGKVIGEIAFLNKCEVIDFFDDRINDIKDFPFTIVDTVENLKIHFKKYDSFFVAIGDNELRSQKLKWLKENELNIVNLIHPKSTVSEFSSLGKGICVMANAVINAGSLVKDGVIINTSASVDHDCFIDDYSHISPNCSLSGEVKIGKLTHLGTGSSVYPGINIGNNVRSGVGSKIFKNILDGTIYKN